jgi:hypothetical protein
VLCASAGDSKSATEIVSCSDSSYGEKSTTAFMPSPILSGNFQVVVLYWKTCNLIPGLNVRSLWTPNLKWSDLQNRCTVRRPDSHPGAGHPSQP